MGWTLSGPNISWKPLRRAPGSKGQWKSAPWGGAHITDLSETLGTKRPTAVSVAILPHTCAMDVHLEVQRPRGQASGALGFSCRNEAHRTLLQPPCVTNKPDSHARRQVKTGNQKNHTSVPLPCRLSYLFLFYKTMFSFDSYSRPGR